MLGPERLAGLVGAAVGAPVEIEEFVGAWSALPRRLQTRLGAAHAGLGRGAALGPRIFSRQSRMEIRIGPLALADYRDFLPGGARLETLRKAVLHGVGETLDVDFRPLLRAREIPAARIGAVQIGRTAWLTPARAADAARPAAAGHRRARHRRREGGGMSLLMTLVKTPRPQAVRQVRLEEGELVIGRSAEADWRIDDPDQYVSRAHCTVTGRAASSRSPTPRAAGSSSTRRAPRSGPAGRRRSATGCGSGSATT